MGRLRQLMYAVDVRVRAVLGRPKKVVRLHAELRTSASLVARVIRKKVEPVPLQVDVHDSFSLADKVILRAPGESTDGIRVANDLISVADDLYSDGTVAFSITGKPAQGEESTVLVCNILRQHLNRHSLVWGEPTNPVGREEGVDCELPHRDSKTKLKIQVVRAEASPELRRSLGRGDSVADQSRSEEIADALQAAIEHKRTRAFGDIALALDATDTPRFAFAPIVSSFRKRHGAWARQVGFKEIWVVGPIPDLVEQLDIQE